MLVELQDDVTGVPPMVTLPDAPRLVPVRVTLVPTGPDAGEMPVSVGSVADATVKEMVSAVPRRGATVTV